MASAPELVVFSQNKLGGIQTFYHNLLQHDEANLFEKLWIFTDYPESKDARLIKPFGCCREVVFTLSERSLEGNVRNLARLISNRPGLVLTNHEIELVTLHKNKRSNKTIVYVCHDEMYIANAIAFEFLIDVFICHNTEFYNRLISELPEERRGDVYYLPFGVRLSPFTRSENRLEPLKLIFIARLHKLKGVYDLQKIDDELQHKGVFANWTIIGDGPEKENLLNLFARNPRFTFHTPAMTEEIYQLARHQDVFVLPSYLDGMPVALLEAMSLGLVPVIYEFNQGIKEVVKNGIGFILGSGDFAGIASKVEFLNSNREEMERMSRSARALIESNFEVKANALAYYKLFADFEKLKRPMRYPHAKYFGRLDYPFVPKVVRDFYRFLRLSRARS